jgi:hypothetical protein
MLDEQFLPRHIDAQNLSDEGVLTGALPAPGGDYEKRDDCGGACQ